MGCPTAAWRLAVRFDPVRFDPGPTFAIWIRWRTRSEWARGRSGLPNSGGALQSELAAFVISALAPMAAPAVSCAMAFRWRMRLIRC
jgi:hypothetical protein